MTAMAFCEHCLNHHKKGRCPLDVTLPKLARQLPDAGHIEPGPFDAYETAKPNEPVFTLQGGDPFAPHLVLLWANMARMAAGSLSYERLKEAVLGATNPIPVEEDEVQRNTLLLKATSAEEVAWAMQAYQRDWAPQEEAQQPRVAGEYRQDIYDARKTLADWCSRAESELAEAVERVQTFEHSEEEQLYYAAAFHAIANAQALLRTAGSTFRPHRAGEKQGT